MPFAHRSCRPFAILADYRLQRKYACIVRLPAPPLLVFSANIRLHAEACFTTTRKLLKQHREHFYSSKRNDIDNRAVFPHSITPKERVRAQVRPPLTSLYTEHYSALNAWPTPRQHSTSINNLWKRYPITQVQYANGYSKRKTSITSLRPDASLRAHSHIRAHTSAPERLRLSTALNLPTPQAPFSRFLV